MTSELLLQSISKHVDLSEKEEDHLVSFLNFKKIRRKQVFLREGDIQRQLIFVIKGCLRSYSIDTNGFEHILQFAPAGWWISDMQSMIREEPATLYIDAVDDSDVILIANTVLQEIFADIPKMERFFRILAENALATYQHRLIDNLSLPALERYKNFCHRYPSLIEVLPQKQVAAYIGVTPEFLSKMLGKAAVKK